MKMYFNTTQAFSQAERDILNIFKNQLEDACCDAGCTGCIFESFCASYHCPPDEMVGNILMTLGIRD